EGQCLVVAILEVQSLGEPGRERRCVVHLADAREVLEAAPQLLFGRTRVSSEQLDGAPTSRDRTRLDPGTRLLEHRPGVPAELARTLEVAVQRLDLGQV